MGRSSAAVPAVPEYVGVVSVVVLPLAGADKPTCGGSLSGTAPVGENEVSNDLVTEPFAGMLSGQLSPAPLSWKVVQPHESGNWSPVGFTAL